MIVGDYNNVLTVNNRIGGHPVQHREYEDLEVMMNDIGLFEHTYIGNHFTWCSNHKEGTIYSRIGIVICNSEWHMKFPYSEVEILKSHISYHSPIMITYMPQNNIQIQSRFRFLSMVTKVEDFLGIVKCSWEKNFKGKSMYILRRKMKRLQPLIRGMSRKKSFRVKKIQSIRDSLDLAQKRLNNDMFNEELILKVQHQTQELMQATELEERILEHRAKIHLLKNRDGNNAFFHTMVKEKKKQQGTHRLEDMSDNTLTEMKDI